MEPSCCIAILCRHAFDQHIVWVEDVLMCGWCRVVIDEQVQLGKFTLGSLEDLNQLGNCQEYVVRH